MGKILVTGAGGYLGCVLTPALLDAGHSVVGLDRYFFGTELLGKGVLTHPKFTLLKQDIRWLECEDFQGVDWVIDLAGLSNDPTSDLDVSLTRQINFLGACNVLNKAKQAGVSRYIYISSCSVYGSAGDELINEESELRPVSTYAETKVLAENAALKLADSKFSVTILRLATLFGVSPRMRFDLAVNLMTLCAWRDRKIVIAGGGRQWRPFVHLSDVVKVIQKCLSTETSIVANQIYNVAAIANSCRIFQLACNIRGLFPDVKFHVSPDDADKRSYRVDGSKLKRDFGIEPVVSPIGGAREITTALENGEIDFMDPRSNTLKHYRKLIEAEELFQKLQINGKMI